MRMRVNPIKLSIVMINVLFWLLMAILVIPGIIDAFKTRVDPFMLIAVGVAVICLVAVAILSVSAKRRSGRYPDELRESHLGHQSSPGLNIALSAIMVMWLLVSVLARFSAAKPALALTVPGASIVMLFFWMIHIFPRVQALGVEGFRGGLRMGVFVFSTLAVATLLYAGAQDTVVGTISPYLAWPVAVVEASILVPVLMWIERRTQEWAQNYLTPAPQIILPGQD